MTTTIELLPDHGYVLMTASLIAIYIMKVGFRVFVERQKTFDYQFMQSNFGEEHKKLTGNDISLTLGYPDMGDGYYGRKLSYGAWYNFAKIQRTHYQFLEQIASCLILLLTAGILYPKCASFFGMVFLVARVIYTHFYITKGPEYHLRQIASIFHGLSILMNFIITFYSGLKIAKFV